MDKKYSIPSGLRVYAIGDVHGHADVLAQMHEEIAIDLVKSPAEKVHVIYMGDYVDRGPDSVGVVAELMLRARQQDGVERSFLLGNHEAMMLQFLISQTALDGQHWLKWGGVQTLQSYGVEAAAGAEVLLPGEIERAQRQFREVMPREHLEFLKVLQPLVQVGDYVFVHAGVHPEVPLRDQKVGHVVSIREPFLSWNKPLGYRVVHGHTITPDKKPEVLPHRIGIDTGLYDGGALTAVALEGTDVRFLQVGGVP